MKKLYLTSGLSVVLVLTSLSVQAQADFRPGYVVRLTGDTVRGQVNYRNARLGATQCLFRNIGEQAPTTWLPNQLKGYGLLSGEHFTSQLTPMPVPATVPAAGPPPARQLFLEILAEGAASLLSWKDDQGVEHFYVQKAEAAQPTELVRVRQQVQDGGIVREQIVPLYKGTLTEQFADCPAVLLSISRTDFKANSLIALINSYNACRRPGQVVAVRAARTKATLELLAGGQASRTTYTSQNTSSTAAVSAGVAPELGMGLSIGRRVLRQKLTFRVELHYVRQVAETSAPTQVDIVGRRYDLRFTTAYLRLPALVRYTLPGNQVRPFVEAGGSFNYATTADFQRRVASTTGADWQPLLPVTLVVGNAYRRYEFGLLAGVGVQFPSLLSGHSLAVLGRLEQSDGFFIIGGYGASVVRGNVLVSLGLTKSK